MKTALLTSQMKLALGLSVGLHAVALIGFRTVYTPPRLVGGGGDQEPTLTVFLSPPQNSAGEGEREPSTNVGAELAAASEFDTAQPVETPRADRSNPPPPPTETTPESPPAAPVRQRAREAAPQSAAASNPSVQRATRPASSLTVASTVSQERAARILPGDSPAPSFVATRALPRYRVNPPPPYPALARRRGQQGLVRLSVLVTPGGEAAHVSIRHSSGFPLLDEAAQRAVRRWQFEPARRGALPVQSEIEVPVQFTLAP
jgi:protein TonB